MNAPAPFTDPRTAGPDRRLIAWVDGVGAFLLCLDDRTTLGGLSGRADIRFAADLAAEHATIYRSGEGHIVTAAGPTIIAGEAPRREEGVRPPGSRRTPCHGNGRVVDGSTDLVHNDELVMARADAAAVRLRYSRPNPLTATAMLTVASEHRTDPRYDAVVLLAEVCLLGPGGDAHIRCRDWEQSVLIFRRDGKLWCKSERPLVVGGREASGPVSMTSGDHVFSEEISFRLE